MSVLLHQRACRAVEAMMAVAHVRHSPAMCFCSKSIAATQPKAKPQLAGTGLQPPHPQPPPTHTSLGWVLWALLL